MDGRGVPPTTRFRLVGHAAWRGAARRGVAWRDYDRYSIAAIRLSPIDAYRLSPIAYRLSTTQAGRHRV